MARGWPGSAVGPEHKALHNLEDFRFHPGNELYGIKKEGREASKAVQSLTTTAASQLNALTSKVDLLVKCRSQSTQDTLKRKVEELSGQLAQRSRQQQELLDKILEKVSTPPTPQVQVLAAPGPSTPRPHPRPTPAITREGIMQDLPTQETPSPPGPAHHRHRHLLCRHRRPHRHGYCRRPQLPPLHLLLPRGSRSPLWLPPPRQGSGG